MLSLFITVSVAFAQTPCLVSSKPSGFTRVASDKAYFVAAPLKDAVKTKKYLVTKDFVQIIRTEGDFTCALFRNFNGKGGRKTIGWVKTSDLEPIRKTLDRKDLVSSWVADSCGDESCGIDIADEAGKLQVMLQSYLHDHPGVSLTASKITESPGHLTLSHFKGSDMPPETIQIEYAKTKEPGTIEVTGSEMWAGTYHR